MPARFRILLLPRPFLCGSSNLPRTGEPLIKIFLLNPPIAAMLGSLEISALTCGLNGLDGAVGEVGGVGGGHTVPVFL